MIILLAGIVVAYLARPGAGRRPFTAADLCAGLVGGAVGMTAARHLGIGAAWQLGLPLLIASALALGIQSLQRRYEF
jgi:hypothetical protein